MHCEFCMTNDPMDVLFDLNKPGDNPFADEELPQTHYYPSTHRQLTDKEKQVKLSATHQRTSKSNQPSKSELDSAKHASPSERRFLQASNTMLARELPTHDTPSPRDVSAKFDESWPASERPSTIESPSDISQVSSKLSSVKLSDYLKKPTTSSSSVGGEGWGSDDISRDIEHWRTSLTQKESPAKESTLAKYIRRFRYSEPKSREERAQNRAPATREFWWMTQPSHSSTPTDDSKKQVTGRSASGIRGTSQLHQRSPFRAGQISQRPGVRRSVLSSSNSQNSKHTTPSSSSFASSVLDKATAQLQAKADKLLEISESTLLSEPAVSSEGVGLYPSSATTEESLYIPEILPTRTDVEGYVRPGIQSDMRPEDDILYQWRVKRRLEQARQHSETHVGPGLNLGEPHIPTVQSKQPDDGGSRLEDFRKRLKQHQLSSHTRPDFTNLLTETDESVRHMGTDPIPQSIATQTNGMLPSSGSSVLPSSGHNLLNPAYGNQSVPVAKERLCDEYMGYEQDVPERDNAESQQGKYSQFETEDDEHLSDAWRGGRKHLIASPHIERTSAPAKGQMSSVAPHWHLACDIIPCEQSDPHVHVEEVAKNGDRDSLTHIEQSATNDIQRTRHRQEGGQKKTVRRRTNLPHDANESHSHSQNTGERKENQKQKRDGISQERLENHPRQRLDFENVVDESPKTPPQFRPTKDRGHGVVDGKVRGERLPETHVQPSPVTSAIGQVISSRLFTSTPTPVTHSPQSSVDTLPSMQHSPSTQSGSIATNDDDIGSTSSDGEFGDDELLQMLRRQRAEYEQQLQHLDQLIEKAQ